MQKNRVKALYQDWKSLKQVTGFAAFSGNVSQSSAKVRKELASWSAWYSQVLEGNGSKLEMSTAGPARGPPGPARRGPRAGPRRAGPWLAAGRAGPSSGGPHFSKFSEQQLSK